MGTALSGGDPAAGPTTFGQGVAGGPGGGFGQGGPTAQAPGGAAGGLAPAPGSAGPAGGNPGMGTADAALITYLQEHAAGARWIVAVSGSGSAAAIQLASGLPVMAMGGFNGSDAAPTLEQLQAYVASGELRYVLLGSAGGGGGGGGPGSPSTSARDAWITSTCTAVDTGSAIGTLYDCAATTGG